MNLLKYSMLIMLLLLAGAVSAFADSQSWPGTQAITIKQQITACTTPQWFIQFVADIKDSDDKAAAEIVASGKCFPLNPGLIVYTQDIPSPVEGDFVAIRVRGTNQQLWTLWLLLTGHSHIK